ncbi:hypothetical protein [Adonisia turfae]|uniref:RHS repeat protein n=1 Tax=Adonisia turfae CCMR0081 TaxID=2292702 RepID=A0A6M0RIK2_9CYAN|nr:hypothetical protein [Adonisia turfae]NEZ56034.1 hypothetical protein [Adonisia turfae CCMR0081]
MFNYEYDNEGDRIRRTRISDGTVTTYEWDHRQRLVAVSEGAEGAIDYPHQEVNSSFWNGGPFTIVETGIQTEFLAGPGIFVDNGVDGGIPTYVIPNYLLPRLDQPIIHDELRIP